MMEEDYFFTKRNKKLFRLYSASKLDQTKALVFVCHGLFEHCGRYVSIFDTLTGLGCAVVSHDQSCHGQSDGKMGNVEDFDFMVDDVRDNILDVLEKKLIAETTPIYLYGHSMGGLISINLVLKYPGFVKGLCLEAPALGRPDDATAFKLFAAHFLVYVWPSLKMGSLKSDQLSRDKIFLEESKKDPLIYHGGVTVLTGLTIIKRVDYVVAKLPELEAHNDLHILCCHGKADKLCPIAGSRYLRDIMMTNKSKSTISLKEFNDAKHVLRCEIEPVKTEYMNTVVNWFNLQLDQNQSE